jgi:hypothetical protein
MLSHVLFTLVFSQLPRPFVIVVGRRGEEWGRREEGGRERGGNNVDVDNDPDLELIILALTTNALYLALHSLASHLDLEFYFNSLNNRTMCLYFRTALHCATMIGTASASTSHWQHHVIVSQGQCYVIYLLRHVAG